MVLRCYDHNLNTDRKRRLWIWSGLFSVAFYENAAVSILRTAITLTRPTLHSLVPQTIPTIFKSKRFWTFLHLYVFYVCATFHCIWRSRFKVICTLVSALKSKLAAISMETKRGKKIFFFSPYFYTDHNKCKMKWVDWKMSKTVFRPAPPLNRSNKWVIHTRPGAKTIKKNTNSTQNKSETHRAKQ